MTTERAACPAAGGMCRCPACNPIHNTAVRQRRAAKHGPNSCPLCEGKKLIPIKTAESFLHHLQGLGESTPSFE